VIKSISLLTRKEGMTHEQFVDHWVRIHAPLAHAVPELRRYVQAHIVEERRRPDIPALDVEVDGIAELWYDDRTGARIIGRIKTFTVEEKVIVSSPRSA